MAAVKPFLVYLLVFIVGEIVAFIVFPMLRRTIAGTPAVKRPDIETFKGILERVVIFVGLTSDYATVLVLFGALKLGTRLTNEGDARISNNYFLIGNFVSVLISLSATIVAKHWIK